ncbi:MAG: PP2C family protein-serine/threonine phosphatase [Phycisphaerales bacterium]
MTHPRSHRRDDPLVFAAIFLMSAPIGLLWMMGQGTPQGWAAGLVSAVLSGAISVAWAYAFIKERWWILGVIIPAQIIVPVALFRALGRAGLFEIGMGVSAQGRIIVLAIACVAFTVAGFALLFVHLRKTERRSARAIAELDLAREVHRTLAPPIALTTATAEVHGRSVPSSSMGGDLIDAVAGEGRLDVLLGDVSGHGVGAGVVMAMLKSCTRTRLLRGADVIEIVSDANRVLADLTASDMFATFVAMRLSPNGTLEYALAGHLPIFHHRAADGRWERYSNDNLPLGIDGRERFTSGTTQLARGDIIAVFTDGLMEVQDRSGRELGLEGVGALLAQSLASALPAMHEKVMAGVASHGPQLDDQSLVLMRVS